jgi:hypothetical protein
MQTMKSLPLGNANLFSCLVERLISFRLNCRQPSSYLKYRQTSIQCYMKTVYSSGTQHVFTYCVQECRSRNIFEFPSYDSYSLLQSSLPRLISLAGHRKRSLKYEKRVQESFVVITRMFASKVLSNILKYKRNSYERKSLPQILILESALYPVFVQLQAW